MFSITSNFLFLSIRGQPVVNYDLIPMLTSKAVKIRKRPIPPIDREIMNRLIHEYTKYSMRNCSNGNKTVSYVARKKNIFFEKKGKYLMPSES